MMKRPIQTCVVAFGLVIAGNAAAQDVDVYKSETCSCCKSWVAHLQQNGLNVRPHDVADVVPYKIRAGVTPALAACHTATVEGYVIEGHVPAADIKRLLAERPDARGLAVPGMPVGSPGMEDGNRKEPYDVLLIHRDGSATVFASH